MAAKTKDEGPRPDMTSRDYDAMAPYMTMAADLLEGADAVRAAGEKYLPRLPQEDWASYEYRRRSAKYVGIFRDVIESLAAKPFRREIALTATASPKLKALAEDIDGAGNSLHVFAATTFFAGIAFAVDWILVEYSRPRPNADGRPLTQAEEAAQGLRPYWVRVAAQNLIAVETRSIGGEEQVTHARILEERTERDGFKEVVRRRVRVLNRERRDDGTYGPATWELWEQDVESRRASGPAGWRQIDGGPITIGVIPLVPFIAGRRKGSSWQFVPPMQDVAHLQVEHYQAEADLKNIKTLTAFPMLAGNGVQPELENGAPKPITVGPRAVLYAPAQGDGKAGSWSFIEPQGHSLKFLADSIEGIEAQMRELGRQPLTAQTGNLTVVTTAFAASKANSVVGAWALNLKDALERALAFTSAWLLEEPTGEVDVESEFDVEVQDGTSLDALLKMREGHDLSQDGLWSEMKRRGVLAPEFDPERERKRLLDELPDEDNADDLGAAA